MGMRGGDTATGAENCSDILLQVIFVFEISFSFERHHLCHANEHIS